MSSITDEQKFVDTNFNIIQQFERLSFDELASIVITTLAGILLDFDQSGAKFALPDSEWIFQPENIIAGPPAETIRPRPNPPLPGIPAGPPPVLPIGILNAAEISHCVLINVRLILINKCKRSFTNKVSYQFKLTKHILFRIL